MKRIVIIGAGFGGLAAAKALRHAKAEIWVIDRANHNLFQPLLYQVATTVPSPAQIVLAGKTAIHRADKSSTTNWPRSSASTPLAIADVGTCRRDFRWTTINLPARFCNAR